MFCNNDERATVKRTHCETKNPMSDAFFDTFAFGATPSCVAAPPPHPTPHATSPTIVAAATRAVAEAESARDDDDALPPPPPLPPATRDGDPSAPPRPAAPSGGDKRRYTVPRDHDGPLLLDFAFHKPPDYEARRYKRVSRG